MNVIVADDEFFARKALVKMLEEMDLPITVCGEGENGKEVMELLRTRPVDLVITDIRMPEMDGLALAKFIREQGYPTDVIIETGYADFDYAKTAIHYGVKEYIIKPLNGQELCDSVRKVLEERSRTGMEVFAFSDIVRNADVCRQIFGREGSWGDRSFCMVLANGRDPVRDEPFLGEWLRKHGEFKELRSFYFAGRNEGVWLAFSDERREVSGLFGRRAVLELKTHLPAQVQVSFSLWHGGIGELETAYSECVYAINERILRREQVFFYRQEKQMEEILTVEQERRLYQAAESGALEAAESVVREVFLEAQSKERNIYSFFAALMRVFFVLNRVFYRGGMELGHGTQTAGYLLFDFKIDMYRFYDLEDVWGYVEMLLREVCEQNAETDVSVAKNLVDYLEQHYADDISLGELAKGRYFMSISYLSRLFKEHTGQTFAKYLTKLRMDKAKRFLECGRMAVSDVAVSTGYSDASHFAQIFRKTYGVSPREYQKRFLKEG